MHYHRSGAISKEEIKHVCKEMGVGVGEAELDSIIARYSYYRDTMVSTLSCFCNSAVVTRMDLGRLITMTLHSVSLVNTLLVQISPQSLRQPERIISTLRHKGIIGLIAL